MKIKGVCPFYLCQTSAKVEVPDSLLPHIDRRALAAKILSEKGWTYRDGRMAKSTISIFCPAHRPKRLVTEADFSGDEVVSGTYEDDLTIPVDNEG